jgi:hypothetical protein
MRKPYKKYNQEPRLDGANKSNNKVAIVVAVIAALTSLSSTIFTYYFVERVKNQISEKLLVLESIKVDIAKAQQQTAATAVAIEATRLELQRQATGIEKARLDIQRQTVTIDNSRLGLQRQIAQVANQNESKKAEIDERRRKDEEIRLASELSRAEVDLIPIIEVSCSTTKYTQRLVKLNCSFENKGINKITVKPTKFLVLDSITQKIQVNTIDRLENNLVANSLPPRGRGGNVYDIYLTDFGDKLRNRLISVEIEAVTDAVAVDKFRKIAKGNIDEIRLANLPIYHYTFISNLQD